MSKIEQTSNLWPCPSVFMGVKKKVHVSSFSFLFFFFFLVSRYFHFLTKVKWSVASDPQGSVQKQAVKYSHVRCATLHAIYKCLPPDTCVSINQELCYGSPIYGPTAFASPPISNYSWGSLKSHSKRIRSKNRSKEDIYVCSKRFPDGPFIGDFLVFSETANLYH